MSIVFDSKERIARSNIYSIFGKLLRRCTQNNDNGDILLFEAGLSSLVEEYSFRLNPHWFNRGYTNNNDQYNPEYVCLSICQRIESSEEALLRFLNTVLKHIRQIEEDELSQLTNYLGTRLNNHPVMKSLRIYALHLAWELILFHSQQLSAIVAMDKSQKYDQIALTQD